MNIIHTYIKILCIHIYIYITYNIYIHIRIYKDGVKFPPRPLETKFKYVSGTSSRFSTERNIVMKNNVRNTIYIVIFSSHFILRLTIC